jgi:hypothetical protein
MIAEDKRKQFIDLFNEFVSEYLAQSRGHEHLRPYDEHSAGNADELPAELCRPRRTADIARPLKTTGRLRTRGKDCTISPTAFEPGYAEDFCGRVGSNRAGRHSARRSISHGHKNLARFR